MHRCTEFMMDEITAAMNDPDYIRRKAADGGWSPCYVFRDARDGFSIGDFEEAVRRQSVWDMSLFYTGHVLWYSDYNEPVVAVEKTRDNIGSALAYGKGSWFQRLAWWVLTGSRYRGVCHA